MRRAVVVAGAVAVAALLVPAAPVSAGGYTQFQTAGGCKASAEAGTWFGRTTALAPLDRCQWVAVQLVTRLPSGALVTGTWTYAYPPGQTLAMRTTSNVVVKTHHQARDRAGNVVSVTCFSNSSTCTSGLVPAQPAKEQPDA